VPRKDSTLALLEKIARELGTPFAGTLEAPGKQAAAIKPARVALWDRPGGSMTSGWTRWILERFEYSFKVVMTEDLAKPAALDNFDVLILVDEAMIGQGMKDLVPEFRKFLEKGGTILAIGSSTSLGKELGLPLASHLVAPAADGKSEPLPRDKYYIQPSVLRVKVDNAQPLAWGVSQEVDVMFSNSPTFKWDKGAKDDKGMQQLAWFDSKTPLRSGWALGQHYLEGGTAMIDARVGKGRLALLGPQVLFRGQPHGTFKLVFNGIVQAGVRE
jgi:hypothetical protein